METNLMNIETYVGIKVYVNSEDIHKKNLVYKLIFPNGKVYIGQTVQLLKNRLYRHCYNAFNKKNKDFYSIKYNAIRKYMEFQVEVLYQGEDLDNQEQYFIKFYNSTNKEFGYNLESGGSLNKTHSEETKKKMSESHKGKKIGKYTRPIIVTEIKTGIETKFNSIEDASRFYEIGSTSISEILYGRNKTFKNKQYTAKYNN